MCVLFVPISDERELAVPLVTLHEHFSNRLCSTTTTTLPPHLLVLKIA